VPNLILIRHSQVSREAIGPDTDWPLSPEGRDLCIPVADALRPYSPQVVVSSEMRRARETAELTATHLGIPWRTAAGLEEHHRPFVPGGRRPDADFAATMRRFFASPTERVFGEESADECRTRFSAAVDAILDEEPARNVAIVSHGTVIALYAAPFFNLPSVDLWQRIAWPSFMVIDTATGTGLHLAESL
jgi:broad specificity phosphatase PhoE